MYNTDKYFSKNTNGKIIMWQGIVNDHADIIIKTGQMDGKIRQVVNSNVEAKGKETKYQQAVKELKAKAKLKEKKGYKTLDSLGIVNQHIEVDPNKLYLTLNRVITINKTDSNNILKPMKAVQFQSGKFKYPAIVQPKINGFRNTAMLVKDLEGMFASGKTKVKLLTKEGHEYVVPHISSCMPEELFDGNTVFDGEIYVHNEILSNIKRRLPMRKIDSDTVSNNSLPILPLTFCIFDLSIPDMSQIDRINLKDELLSIYPCIYYNSFINTYEFAYDNRVQSPILNVKGTIIYSDEDAQQHLRAALDSGFEGVVIRTLHDEYMFGGRRTNMMKLKGLKHSEFKIIDVILKNQDSTRTYVDFRFANDINDLTFDTPTQGTEEDREEYLNNAEEYIGKIVTIGFGERTVNGLPFHIKTLNFREEYDMDINDLNIEI
jgi:hypothetical protein